MNTAALERRWSKCIALNGIKINIPNCQQKKIHLAMRFKKYELITFANIHTQN
jgi:hypothetical protein